MINGFVPFEKVKKAYPDKWVLLGNPEIKDTEIIGGIVVYHSKHKKELCSIGQNRTQPFLKVTIAFTGNRRHSRTIGVIKRNG